MSTRLICVLKTTAVVVASAAVALGAATNTAIDGHPAPAASVWFGVVPADRSALTALVSMYNPATGLWPIAGVSAWWSSANDLSALIGAERALGTRQYDTSVIARTYELDQNYTGPDFRNNGPDFKNNYYDDTEWWGLAWLDAYRWTGDLRYLATAEGDDAYVHAARVSNRCGTAIPWAVPIIKNGGQLTAISNELGLELAAELAETVVPQVRTSYRNEALADWEWLQRSGLIGQDGLVRDHLDATCHPDGPAWSYNQGSLSAGLAALAAATGDSSYLTQARRLADAATTNTNANPGGVLFDPCESSGNCSVDGATFKGADVRGLGVLNQALLDHPYTTYLTRQATTMFRSDRMAGDAYGEHWTGAPNAPNAARQGSAVDLLTATVWGVRR